MVPCGCNQILSPDAPTAFNICDNAGSPEFVENGLTQIAQGQTLVKVVFATTKASNVFTFVELAVENVVDASPFSIDADLIARSTTGFTVALDSIPDTGNYRLRWSVVVTQIE